jgi:hypothetical protein
MTMQLVASGMGQQAVWQIKHTAAIYIEMQTIAGSAEHLIHGQEHPDVDYLAVYIQVFQIAIVCW